MSRLANKPIKVPNGVEVKLDTQKAVLSVMKAGKELSQTIHDAIECKSNQTKSTLV